MEVNTNNHGNNDDLRTVKRVVKIIINGLSGRNLSFTFTDLKNP